MKNITYFLFILAKFIGFSALALVIVYAFAVYKNWEKVAPSDDYQALVKIVESRKEIPEEKNAFFALGIEHPKDGTIQHKIGEFPSVPDCKPKACQYNDELAEYVTTHTISEELQRSYDDMLTIQHYQRPMRYVNQDQVPEYRNIVNAHNWYLLLLFQETDAVIVSEKLAQDYAFWENMLAQSDNWIHTEISNKMLIQNLYIGEQLRRKFPTLSIPNNWQAPFTIDDFNLAQVIATGNYGFIKHYEDRKNVLVDFGYFRNSILKKLGYLGYPLYDQQAIKNDIASSILSVIDFYKDAPLDKLNSIPPTKSSPDWLSLENIAGKAMFHHNLEGESLYLPHDYLKALLSLEAYRQEIVGKFE